MRVALGLYTFALRALPREFRERYGAALRETARSCLEAAGRRGRSRLIARLARECWDVALTGVRLRLRERGSPRARPDRARREHMRSTMQDLRIAVRTHARAPGFALMAALTLGAGVGCATVAFHLIDTLLLQRLPHPNADRLVMVWNDLPALDMPRAPISYPTLLDLRAATDALASLEAYTGGAGAVVATPSGPERVSGVRVTGGLLGALGNRALLGRTIVRQDDDPAADPVVLVSHQLWQGRLGGAPDVVGSSLLIGDVPHRIVGVMPADFQFPSARTEFWVPLRARTGTFERDLNFLTAIGVLRRGSSVVAAQVRLQAAYERLRALYPADYETERLRVESRQAFIVGNADRLVVLGACAAGLLLLVACANLGNLLLVRGFGRRRELAVRAALGASRRRIVAGLVADGAVIGSTAAAVAVLLAAGLIVLVALLGADSLPRSTELGLDARAAAFAVSTALLAAWACALIPVGRATLPARAVLGTSGGSPPRSGRRLQSALVVTQVALSFTLLVTAALLGTTLSRLLSVPRGFDGERVLTLQLTLPESRYASEGDRLVFYERLFERLRALHGVESVGGVWALPFSPDYASMNFLPADRPHVEPVPISATPVRGDFFAAAGMRLLRGRDFDARDDSASAAVAIVNEALARRFWGSGDALGRYLARPTEEADPPLRIVGIVNDVRTRDLAAAAQPQVYLPQTQQSWGGSLYVTVRTIGEPMELSAAVRAELAALDPQLPVSRLATLDELVHRSVATPRFRATVVYVLSIAAAIVTLIGIFSVQAVFVASHRRDLAVRNALGASPGRIVNEVAGRGVRLTALGIAIGALGAAAAGRALEGMLFELSPTDPLTFGVVALAFLAAGALSSYLPARRIGLADAMKTLRQD